MAKTITAQEMGQGQDSIQARREYPNVSGQKKERAAPVSTSA
jgi:hypothetical protein